MCDYTSNFMNVQLVKSIKTSWQLNHCLITRSPDRQYLKNASNATSDVLIHSIAHLSWIGNGSGNADNISSVDINESRANGAKNPIPRWTSIGVYHYLALKFLACWIDNFFLWVSQHYITNVKHISIENRSHITMKKANLQ